jgi:hypothetical protein
MEKEYIDVWVGLNALRNGKNSLVCVSLISEEDCWNLIKDEYSCATNFSKDEFTVVKTDSALPNGLLDY